jgi:hypothetical protein
MKQVIIFSYLLFATAFTNAQNVGIGTLYPTEKLEVHNPVNSVVKISSANYNDTSRLILSNRDNTNAGTDFLLTAIQEQGLLISTRSDLANNNNDSLLVLKSSGRLGLGVKNPVTKLDVNGGARIAIFNTIEFGGGVAGKEINAGKIGYQTFTVDALDIVGAGSSTTDRKVKLYAEGGTTLTGPINIAGALQVYGNSGTAGQVLTSNGTASPAWTNSAFSNTTRFGIYFSDATHGGGNLNPQQTLYNTNPADITIGASSITINHTGLYHFNGNINGIIQTNTAFSAVPAFSIDLNFQNYGFYLQENKQMQYNPGQTDLYSHYELFSQDFYIVAPQTISVQSLYNYSGGSPTAIFYSYMKLYGYRISD